MERSLYAETTAQRDGLLQRLDPRVKLVGMLALIIASAASVRLSVILTLFGVAVALALASHISVATLATRAWLGALLFSGALALPALVLTPGTPLVPLGGGWAITEQGTRSALLLISRAGTAITYSLLLILTTPWGHILKALRVLRVPIAFVVVLGMTYRYIFLMLQTAHDMFEARRSRQVGVLLPQEQRRLATASVGVLLSKSFQLSNDIFLAMQSRGYRGEVYMLDTFRMQRRDWIALVVLLAVACVAGWIGRR